MQVGDKIRRLILSGARIISAGNMIVIGGTPQALKEAYDAGITDQDFIYSKAAKRHTKMEEKNGLFKYPLWVKRRVRKESINEGLDKEADDGAGVSSIIGKPKKNQNLKGIIKMPNIELIESE